MSEDYSWVKMRVMGNCGLLHESVEGWQKCKMCDLPRPHHKLWFREMMGSFVEKIDESK